HIDCVQRQANQGVVRAGKVGMKRESTQPSPTELRIDRDESLLVLIEQGTEPSRDTNLVGKRQPLIGEEQQMVLVPQRPKLVDLELRDVVREVKIHSSTERAQRVP